MVLVRRGSCCVARLNELRNTDVVGIIVWFALELQLELRLVGSYMMRK